MATAQTSPVHTSIKARPAEPLLASSLIDGPSLSAILDNLDTYSTTSVPFHSLDVLRTGVKSLDDALGYTLQSGRVVAFSSENSGQRDDLAKALLVECLVRHAESSVAVIDTTGNFDVVGLYVQILKRLEKDDGTGLERGGANSERVKKREERAAKVLDRVNIMRVFDFVGVREAVGELRDGLEGRTVRAEDDGSRQGKQSEDEVVEREEVEADNSPSPPQKRTEVADSEDEDEQMLFDIEATTTEQMAEPTPAPASAPPPPPATSSSQQEPLRQQPQPQPKLKLILLSTLAHVLTPLLKKDPIATNALCITFLTTLSNLTRTHSLHTILLNPCSTPRPPSPSRRLASSTHPQTNVPAPPQQQSHVAQPPPPPSIFSSQLSVPALMGLMSRYADAHVLVSEMPRRKGDARVFYADNRGRERGKRRGVEMVGVCEVLGERWGGRVGAWGTFKAEKEGRGIEGV